MFCQITINSTKLSLSGSIQLLISIAIYSIAILTILFSDNRKFTYHELKNHKHILLICLLLIIIVLSCLYSTNQNNSIKRALILVIPSASIFLITLRIKEPSRFCDGIALGIITITIISIIFGITGLIGNQNYVTRIPKDTIIYHIGIIEFTQKIAHRAFIVDDTTYYIQRYAGIIPNPNGLGLIAAISFGLSYNIRHNKFTRWIISIILLVGIALSFSRMGILLFFSIIIYMNCKSLHLRRMICGSIIYVILLFIIMASKFSQNKDIIGDLFFFRNFEFLQIRERADLFKNAWQGFSDNWLTGVGYGVGAEYLFAENAATQAVHSVFLNALLEIGLVGTILLVALWLIPVFSNNEPQSEYDKSENRSQIIAAILFGLFIAEAFDLSVTRFHYIHLIFCFLLGIWFSLRQVPKDAALQNVQNSETQELHDRIVEPNRGTDN
ncbi:MAG: O-antigen ligase family protein [Thalassospira sp.]|uniref:O-antigen ligase family protein n=1 Tax=Thalassospira sp. TaxID=1912094 RepID=UPI0032EC3AB0